MEKSQFIAGIEERNRLRAESGLPLLSVEKVLQRAKRVEFRKFYARDKWRRAHLHDGVTGFFGHMIVKARTHGSIRAAFDSA